MRATLGPLSSFLAAALAVKGAAAADAPPTTLLAVVPPPLVTANTTVLYVNSTVTVPCNTSAPYPIVTSPSGLPVPSGNSSFTSSLPLTTASGTPSAVPPVPTTTNAAVPTTTTAGAALISAQDSLAAMGVVFLMAVFAL
ncbi:hypothetical protein AAL_04598 [Moelleriella libera RCEF 2490]|uniref:Uncharacterized protein n=1 Tax=Moelleriella libera RCEF 2490 TaxID=1081109 RepID=A0A168BIY4_9HYPO|nr:hypothetical protein AAL_04598 [Moelleriella libera RCEF 2490]